MSNTTNTKHTSHDLLKQIESLLQTETNVLANLSNFIATMYDYLDNINWFGFYFVENSSQDLILGNFQGKVACTRLRHNIGVCQKSFLASTTIIVEDVHAFTGHIACDPISQSEIVVPIFHQKRVIGVLDIDSPIKTRFNQQDAIFLETSIELLNKYIDWQKIIGLYN